jgi:hypothetical protein
MLQYGDAVVLWGQANTTRLATTAAELASTAALTEACEFLETWGLPTHLTFRHPELPSTLSFARLVDGLQPFDPPYLVLGLETFDNGSALWCLDSETGYVYRIDVELEIPTRLVNTSVGALAGSLSAAFSWSNSVDVMRGNSDGPPRTLEVLEATLHDIDGAALSDPETYWPWLLAEWRLTPAFRVVAGRT